MTYQKTLENYEYLIKYAFPNPILIINEEKNGLIFTIKATQNFFSTNDHQRIFQEIKNIQLPNTQSNSPNSGILTENNSIIPKDLNSFIQNFKESFSNLEKFATYDGYLAKKI